MPQVWARARKLKSGSDDTRYLPLDIPGPSYGAPAQQQAPLTSRAGQRRNGQRSARDVRQQTGPEQNGRHCARPRRHAVCEANTSPRRHLQEWGRRPPLCSHLSRRPAICTYKCGATVLSPVETRQSLRVRARSIASPRLRSVYTRVVSIAHRAAGPLSARKHCRELTSKAPKATPQSAGGCMCDRHVCTAAERANTGTRKQYAELTLEANESEKPVAFPAHAIAVGNLTVIK